MPATGPHYVPNDSVQRQKAVIDDVPRCHFPVRNSKLRNHQVEPFPGYSCDGNNKSPSKAASKSTNNPNKPTTKVRTIQTKLIFPTTIPSKTIMCQKEVPTSTPYRNQAKEVSP